MMQANPNIIFECHLCKADLSNFYNWTVSYNAECSSCRDRCGFLRVITTYTPAGIKDFEKLYLHIYLDLNSNNSYHIRFHLKENMTVVMKHYKTSDGLPIFSLDGFPFTEDNIKEKLRTYLMFS